MRRLRTLFAMASIAAVISIAGGTTGTPTAGAFVTIRDQCASYFSNYWYWGNEYLVAYEDAGYETPYSAFAYANVQYYGNLIQSSSC